MGLKNHGSVTTCIFEVVALIQLTKIANNNTIFTYLNRISGNFVYIYGEICFAGVLRSQTPMLEIPTLREQDFCHTGG